MGWSIGQFLFSGAKPVRSGFSGHLPGMPVLSMGGLLYMMPTAANHLRQAPCHCLSHVAAARRERSPLIPRR